MSSFFNNLFNSKPEAIFTGFCTLIGVLIGGLISWFSTSHLEKKRFKLQKDDERLTKILIPYCTLLEKELSFLTKFYDQHYESLHGTDMFTCAVKPVIKDLSEPLTYLAAAKCVYLSKDARNALGTYEYLVSGTNVVYLASTEST